MLDAGGADEDSIAVKMKMKTKRGVAGACGTAPARPPPRWPAAGWGGSRRAGTAHGTARSARRAPPQAEVGPAAQDHDRILEEIQADSAGGFLLEVSDGVSRGHGCLQDALREVHTERGPARVFLEVAAGRDAGVGIRNLPSKGSPERVRHSHRPSHERAPRDNASGGLRTEGNAGSGSWGFGVVYKANSYPSVCTGGSQVRPEGGSRRQGLKQE